MKFSLFLFILVITQSNIALPNPLLANQDETGVSQELNLIIQRRDTTNTKDGLLSIIRDLKQLRIPGDSLDALRYLEVSSTFYKLKNYDSSKWYLERSWDVLEGTNLEILKIKTLDRLGVVISDYGDNDEAIDYYRRALAIAESGESYDHQLWAGKIYGNIGGIYYDLEDYAKALEYASKANEIARGLKNESAYGVYYMQMGLSHLGLRQFREALENLLQSVSFYETRFNPHYLQFGYINVGRVYLQLEDYDNAEVFLQKAVVLADSIEALAETSTENALLAEIAFKRNQLSRAEKFARKALKIAVQYKMSLQEMEAFNMLYRIDSAGQDFRQALLHRNRYIGMNDSLRSQETIQRIAELETKYETEKKEKEIQMANAEIEKRERFQFFLLILIGIIVLFSVGAFILLRQRFHLRQQLLSQEIDNLRLQLNAVLGHNPEGIDLDLNEVNEKLNSPLTEREFDILQLALSDKNNKQIAENVFVSVNTVKYHLKNIYDKLGVSNRKEALKLVIKPN